MPRPRHGKRNYDPTAGTEPVPAFEPDTELKEWIEANAGNSLSDSEKEIVIWGDSLTASGTFGDEIETLYGDGRTVDSNGIGAESSFLIGARVQGEYLAYPRDGVHAPSTGGLTVSTHRAFYNYNESGRRIFDASYVSSWETYGQTWAQVENVNVFRNGEFMGNAKERLLLGSTDFASDANRITVNGPHELQNGDYIWFTETDGATIQATDGSATGGAYQFKPYIVDGLVDGLVASDFETDVSGFVVGRAGDTLAANTDSVDDGNVVGDDALLWTFGTNTSIKFLNANNHVVVSGEQVTLEFEFYVPNSNASTITSIYFTIGGTGVPAGNISETNNPGGNTYFANNDGWVKASVTFTASASGNIRFWANGSDADYNGDVVYFRNVKCWNPTSFEILYKTGESPTVFSDDGTGATPLTIHHGWSLYTPNHTSGDVYTIETETVEDGKINVLWIGRNNISHSNIFTENSGVEGFLTSLKGITDRLQGNGRFLVMTPHNATEKSPQVGEYPTLNQGRYEWVKDVQTAIRSVYPDNFFDSQAWMVSQGTSTEQDRDTPASALSNDGVHLSTEGYQAIAAAVQGALSAKGW